MGSGRRGVEPPTKFSKRGFLIGPQLLKVTKNLVTFKTKDSVCFGGSLKNQTFKGGGRGGGGSRKQQYKGGGGGLVKKVDLDSLLI